MVWLKKEILFILSIILIALSSCNNIEKEESPGKVKAISKEELIDNLFTQIQDWSDLSIPLIDSLGGQIALKDSSLSFLPYANDYEANAFIFVAQNRNVFKVFEESSFLRKSISSQQNSYKVWRKKLNELQILDLSIEPHPTLNWLFVIRLRGQE